MKTRKKIIITAAILFMAAAVTAIAVMIKPTASFGGQMSVYQMRRDFKYFRNVIENGLTDIGSYEQAYDTDISEMLDSYYNMIDSGTDEYEFYCILTSAFSMIPSVHTELPFPDYDSYSRGVYNSSVLDDARSSADIWKNILIDRISEADEKTFIGFEYAGGEYLSADASAHDNIGVLRSVSGINSDEFAAACSSVYKIKFDRINNKKYREMLVFMIDNISTDSITVEYENGEKTYNVRFGTEYELPMLYSHLLDEPENSDHEEQIRSFYADDGSIGYIELTDLSLHNDKKVSEMLEKLSSARSLIIDLRRNRGGSILYLENNIYPFIFKNDHELCLTAYMKSNRVNNRIFNNKEYLADAWGFEKANEIPSVFPEGDYYISCENEYFFGRRESECDLYFLVSGNTLSAADRLAHIGRESGEATLIGNNTGGEGLGSMAFTDRLPESGLIFTYMPTAALNSDGISNGAYGTSPDVYCELTKSGYSDFLELIDLGDDPYTYENRLKWDSVLIKTLEIIEGKNNE